MTTPAKTEKPKDKGGRPTKLTPEIRRRAMKAARVGAYRHEIAAYAGVALSTLMRWMREGKAHPQSAFGSFRRDLIAAESAVRVHMLGTIVAARKYDWKAAGWYLERKDEGWARRQRVAVAPAVPPPGSTPDGKVQGFSVNFNVVGVAPEKELPASEEDADDGD